MIVGLWRVLESSVRVALLPLDGAVLSESEVAGRILCPRAASDDGGGRGE